MDQRISDADARATLSYRLWDLIPFGGMWGLVALLLAYLLCFGR